MCTTCGCQGGGQIEGDAHPHAHGGVRLRRVSIERGLLEKNDAYARANREAFARQGIFALNLLCIWFYDLDEKKLQDDPV